MRELQARETRGGGWWGAGAYLTGRIPRPGRPRVSARLPAPPEWMRRCSRPSRPRAPRVSGVGVRLRLKGWDPVSSEGRSAVGGAGACSCRGARLGASGGSKVAERGVAHQTCSFPDRSDLASRARRRVRRRRSKAPHPRKPRPRSSAAPTQQKDVSGASCQEREGSNARIIPIDARRHGAPTMQKKLLILSALMVALACAHAGETPPEITNKVRAPNPARVGPAARRRTTRSPRSIKHLPQIRPPRSPVRPFDA